MLLHAICNELGANLFDISPQNIYETYREKEGIKMLMHLCSKVDRTKKNNFFFRKFSFVGGKSAATNGHFHW
jgi:hypothetical protein